MDKQSLANEYIGKSFLYGIIGGLLGVIIGIVFAGSAVNNQDYGMMNMMGMRRGAGFMTAELGGTCPMLEDGESSGMSMQRMTSTLESLGGDEFDREFINLMIEHHQGAIDMATLVSKRSDRQELRDLGRDIISAQTKEIDMMRGWINEWF